MNINVENNAIHKQIVNVECNIKQFTPLLLLTPKCPKPIFEIRAGNYS